MKVNHVLGVLTFLFITTTHAEEVRLGELVISLTDKCMLSISRGNERVQTEVPHKGKCIFAKDRKNKVAIYKPSADTKMLLIASSQPEGENCRSMEAGLLIRKGQILLQKKTFNEFVSCLASSYTPDQKNFAGAFQAFTNKENYQTIKLE